MRREIVAFQGAPGAFGELAALQLGEPLPCREFADVLAALARGTATRAVLPVENSSIGRIEPVWRLLAGLELGGSAPRAVAQVVIPVRHCLILPAGSPREPLCRVASHPAALAQCRRFFARRPELEAIPTFDTAGALDELAGQTGIAVIAAARAAELRGATVIEHGLEDDPRNATRFLVFAHEPDRGPSGLWPRP